MEILKNKDLEQLKELAKSETSLINAGFNTSNNLGLVFLRNGLKSFVDNYIYPTYGKVHLSMNTRYRTFVIELLNNIHDDYKSFALNELIQPVTKEIGDEELIEILSRSVEK